MIMQLNVNLCFCHIFLIYFFVLNLMNHNTPKSELLLFHKLYTFSQ